MYRIIVYIILIYSTGFLTETSFSDAESPLIIHGNIHGYVNDYDIYLYNYTGIFDASVQYISEATGRINSTITDSLGHYSIEIPLEYVNVHLRKPKHFSLQQNYPNPFNPSTTIQFNTEENADVSLRIYNVTGQLIETLVDGWMPKGTHTVQWNGTDDRGKEMSAGIYMYSLQSGKFYESRKMLMIDGATKVYPAITAFNHDTTVSKKADLPTETYMKYTIKIEKDGYITKNIKNYKLSTDSVQNHSFLLEQHDYFPLEVGNSWTFKPQSEYDDSLYTYTIVGTEEIKGHTYYVFNSFPLFFHVRPLPHVYPEKTLVRKDISGCLRIWEGAVDVVMYIFSVTTPSLTPLSVRLNQYKETFYFAPEITTHLVSVTDTMYSFYSCYQFSCYVHSLSSDFAQYWFAPEIGPVKLIKYDYDIREYVLINATISGAEYNFGRR